MSEITNHIIAKVSWDTSFDWKEKATELQDRLSAWSRIKMPRNITEIFDKFCPTAQTWKIEALEIDLGKIDFNNLEAELDQQINAQLNQKLTDLIIEGNRGHLKIDIQDHSTSQLYFLRYFLVHGLMPWSYQESDGSIQELFAEQLKSNLSKVTDLLREIGTTNLEVRQRIAWQVEEKHIKTIITGLEPNNYEQIIDFSKEIIKVKTKENKIKGNTIDFKKNLWLWILNYLLTERGTIFNKIAFMKSNIKQMADHYNVTYQDFLMLLEGAIHQANLKKLIKHEFIAIISTLVREQVVSDQKTELKKAIPINEWDLLKKYISALHLQPSKAQQNEFNDLIIGLAKKDKARFAALILLLSKGRKWAFNAVSALNDNSLATLFLAMHPEKANELIQQLHFLGQLNKEINLQIDRNTLWGIGLRFLQTLQVGTFSSARFFVYYLDHLSKKGGWKKQQIAKRLIATPISSSIKTISNLTVYTDFVHTIEENNSIKGVGAINNLIEQLTIYPADPKKLELLKSELLKTIQQQPKLALSALIKYAKIADFEQIINECLSNDNKALLLKNVVKEKAVTFAILQKIGGQFKKEQPSFAAWINEKVLQFGLKAVIFYPTLRSTKLLDFILLHLSNTLTPNHLHYFEQFVQLLSQENPIVARNTSLLFHRNKKEYVFQKVLILMSTSDHKKAVSSLLAKGLANKDFYLSDLQKYSKRAKIADYLLNNGNNFLLAMQKEYIKILTKQLPKSKLANALKLVDILLWKCLLGYENHNGNQDQFKKLLKNAITYHLNSSYSIAENAQQQKASHQQNSLISLKNGHQIDYNVLFTWIEECLKNGINQKIDQGITFKLSDLIMDALAFDASTFKRNWTKLALTKKRISLLEEATSFEEFSLWMMAAGNKSANEKIGALNSWYKVVSYLLAGAIPRTIIDAFWNQLWEVEKLDRLSRFVQEILFQITVIKPMNTSIIIAEIKKSDITIPSLLVDILVGSMPNFSLENKMGLEMLPKRLTKSMDSSLLVQLVKQLVLNQQSPTWFASTNAQETKELLNEIVLDHSVQFFLALRHENLSVTQLKWLHETISFRALIKTIGNLNRAQSAMLQTVEYFYFSISKFKSQDISAKEIQFLLFKKVINAWLSGNWKTLAAENIWQELIWEICVQKGVAQAKVIQGFIQIKLQLPPVLQITLDQLIEKQKRLKEVEKKPVMKKNEPKPFFVDNDEILKDSIFIQNAGLVLINYYVPVLFERLGLTVNNKFLPDKQLDAVHYLQFVVTGLMQSPEPELVLNKILCGISLNQPIKNEILMSKNEIKLVEELVTAVISHWNASGSSTIDGFRGNWLIRDGLLIEYDDKWELTIEKRAYDLLLHQSPFTFSIIKYPWMQKPLHVQWPH